VNDSPANAPHADQPEASEAFARLFGELRPKLHRYCARMTGSVIDGEDILQEALLRAMQALPKAGPIARPESWLFRIAHNAALDFLRRRARQNAVQSDEETEMIADPVSAVDDRQAAAASLRTFMRLPVAQRSSVILMDVLGYSLKEIGAVTGLTMPSVKASLHRGRMRLRELAGEPEDIVPPVLDERERSRLALYVDRFNARDFDALRDLLAGEVQLELVNQSRMNGRREVANYFGNYARIGGWRLAPGFVERRPAVLVFDDADPSGTPSYFILLQWSGEEILDIRDFRYARYAMEDADVLMPD
jgi:RNA polymerase sigma-70 factor (ECF subfamily)